mmetsp:Transcript_129991/g.417295  ORF Transcript_129991/g.417295 Transcript_129991/m.417295 type:complete len:331 (+) Transcript_129991:88-1080(+)
MASLRGVPRPRRSGGLLAIAAVVVLGSTLLRAGCGGFALWSAAGSSSSGSEASGRLAGLPALVARSPSLAVAAAEGGDASKGAVARDRFLKVLEEKGGDWRDEVVMAELALLEQANPTADPALSGTYLDADWLQVTRPDYNYGDNKGSTEYTLGALSFGMFEPQDMKVKIEKTTQKVAPNEDGTRNWDISLHISCVDERYPSFKADITTNGKIRPGKDKDGTNRRLEVWFTQGSLTPAAGMSADVKSDWLRTFRTALKEKKWTVGGMLKDGMMRLMMGLRVPESVDDDGTVTFQMNKPPHGYTDILYIDDMLRVTKGNRGSIVAVTRESR